MPTPLLRRRITAVALLVSLLALASSGLMMMIVDRPSFTLRMHPVHKLFGIVLLVAALSHLGLNAAALRAYLRDRAAMLCAAVLLLALVAAYVLVVLSPQPPDLVQQLDETARQLEQGATEPPGR